MEQFLTPVFWAALGQIIIVNIVLSGDNAIVIAMAARNLPAELRKKAIVWGTVGAVAVRVVMTLVVAWLLQIPGLKLVGGLLLLWIAYKLLVDEGDEDSHGEASTNFFDAMKTIMIADAAMGLDNVLGVAAAAKGDMTLIILGLLISIPIVVFGSTVVMKIMDRFPIVIWIGAAVLAVTAGAIIWHEALLAPWLGGLGTVAEYGFMALLVVLTLGLARMKMKKPAR
jgi:YjbE family integral membrane protein